MIIQQTNKKIRKGEGKEITKSDVDNDDEGNGLLLDKYNQFVG